MGQKLEALRLLEDALKELESPKGSVHATIQKLSRAAILNGNEDIKIWCDIQFGDSRFVPALESLLEILSSGKDQESKDFKSAVDKELMVLKRLGLKQEIHFTNEELALKVNKSGGGYVSIGFIEEQYRALVREKRGNDGTYYVNNLLSHLGYVKKVAHTFASNLFNQLKFAGTVSNSFDVLRAAVDDRLLDLNPVLAEQLMLHSEGGIKLEG